MLVNKFMKNKVNKIWLKEGEKNMNEEIIEDMFNELDILERWCDNDYITLDMYYKIKSKIIDVNKEKLIPKDSENLPF